MIAFIQLGIGLLSVTSQVLRMVNNSEEKNLSSKEKRTKVLDFQKALEKAENGDFKEIENMLSMLRAAKLPDRPD